jgi:hypothetical protein
MAVGVLLAFYVCDYLSVRFGIPGHRPTFGTVQVQTMYAVRQKNNRIDYSLGDVIPQTCVNSLFPQMGYTPCWYLAGHRTKQIKIGWRGPAMDGAAGVAAPLAEAVIGW